MLNRRDFVALSSLSLLPELSVASKLDQSMLKRPIPSSGEEIPVIGLGTSRVFDIEPIKSELNVRRRILDIFYENGGRLIDTSPMYGMSEEIIGISAQDYIQQNRFFLATKSCLSSGNPPSLVNSRATNDFAIGITSTGSGNLPKRSTSFEPSIMHTNFLDASAMIFSLVSAPPPPFIIWKCCVISSAPSMYTSGEPTEERSSTLNPFSSSSFVLASELDVTASILFFTLGNALMR